MAGPQLKYARGPPVGLLSNVGANRFPLYKAINLSSGLTREGLAIVCVRERSKCVNKDIRLFCHVTVILHYFLLNLSLIRPIFSFHFSLFKISSLKTRHNAPLPGQCHRASGFDLSLIMLIAVDL